MKTNLVILVSLTCAAGGVSIHLNPGPASPAIISLTGAWQIVKKPELDQIGSPPTPRQSGLLIFTKQYYSLVRVVGDDRKPLPAGRLAGATSAELLAVFGASFTAQGGAYTTAGDILALLPTVAKDPALMTPQALVSYTFKVTETTLTLKQQRTGAIMSFTRVQ